MVYRYSAWRGDSDTRLGLNFNKTSCNVVTKFPPAHHSRVYVIIIGPDGALGARVQNGRHSCNSQGVVGVKFALEEPDIIFWVKPPVHVGLHGRGAVPSLDGK